MMKIDPHSNTGLNFELSFLCAFLQILTAIAMMAVGAICMGYNDLAFDAAGYMWSDPFPRPKHSVPAYTGPRAMAVL